MPTTLQFRRYDSANIANLTGAVGELFIDTDKDTVVVQDGSTVGGFALAREGAYTQANSAYNQANTATTNAGNAYNQANLGYAQANSAYTQANSAYTQANGAYAHANIVYAQANSAYDQANSARDQANTARNTANDAYGQANSAYAEANLKLNIDGGTITGNLIISGNLEVLGNSTTLNVETLSVEDNEIILNSNVTGSPSLDAFVTINRGTSNNVSLKWDENTDQWKWADDDGVYYALNTSLDAYNQANTARNTANDAYAGANTANTNALNAYSQANSAFDQANNARDQANTAYGVANDAYSQANTARDTANDSYAQANAGYAQANAAYGQANDAFAQANAGYAQANAAYGQANTAANTVRVYANSDSSLSNKFLNFINTASIQVVVSDNGDGNANIAFNTSGASVGDAYEQANVARDTANSAYSEANLKLNIAGGSITGDLSISGNLQVLGNSTTLNVETLAVEDNEIILNSNVTSEPTLDAFISINRGTSNTARLKWDENTDQWKWADDDEVFYAFDTALDAYLQANTSYGQANDAYSQANTARGTANDSYAQANTARDTANDAYGEANTANTNALNAYAQANAARDQANSAYGEANLKLDLIGGTITGSLNVAETSKSNVFVSTKTALAAPNLSHFNGERLRLFDFDQVGHPNYAIGVEQNHIWMGVDSTSNNQGFKWYGNTNVAMRLGGNGVLEVANTVITNAFITVAGLNITDQANTARTTANDAYGAANTANSNALNAYGQANNARDQANAAYNDSNTRVLKAGDTITGNLNVSAWLITQNIVPNLNVTYDIGSSDFRFKDIWVSNSTIHIGDADITSVDDEVRITKLNVEILSAASGVNIAAQSSDAYDQANTARDVANGAYAQANTARDTANDAYAGANTANTNALNAYDQANTARDTANGAYAQANGAYAHANIVYSQANAAYDQANSAYAEANLKLNLTGGTINGSLNVSGNLTITGNTKYTNVDTYIVSDPLIYLAANNDLSDLVDIGFMGGHNTAGVYQHSGLARDAGDGTWYLFTGLAEEGHENNVVDFANTTLATLRANINANSILLTGNPVATQANLTLAHNQANTARDQANSARDQANTARNTANDAYAGANTANTNALNAYAQANSARDQANTARNTANDAYAGANTANTNALNAYTQANTARDQANTARNTANDAYAGANTANTNALNAYAQANTARDQANTARNTANDAYAGANTANTNALNAYTQANTARTTANDAYAAANTKLEVAGGTITGDITFNGNVNLAANSTFRSNTVATTTQDVEVTVDAFSTAAYRSALYQAQLTRTSPANDYETITLSVVHDGSTVYLSQYGQNKTNASANMGTFDASIATGTLSLTFKPNVAVVTVKTHRNAITV